MSERDIQPVGQILARAFNDVFDAHGYPPPFSSVRDGIEITQWYLQTEPEHCFVVEIRGQVVGAAFLHYRGAVVSIGPVAVDPKFQGLGLGRQLMERLLQKSSDCRSVRLFQDAFNAGSFALYAKLGFRAAEVVPILALPADAALNDSAGGEIRTVGIQALETLAAIDGRLTNLERTQDLRYLLQAGAGFLLEENGAARGYLCAYSSRGGVYVGPAAAENQDHLHRLLAAARRHFPNQGMIFRIPARHHDLLLRLLGEGFRVANLGTFMVRGEWHAPPAADLLAVFPESL